MGMRHVWQKSNVLTYFMMPDTSKTRDDKMGKSERYQAYNSNYKESGTTERSISSSNGKFIYYTRYNNNPGVTDDFTPVDAYVKYSSGDTYGSIWFVTDYDRQKGATVLATLSGAASLYPASGAAYDQTDGCYYYYDLLGSDSIDPTISYPSMIHGGDSVNVSVTPAENTFGGTISYRYEYSLDGGTTWTSISTTTATSVSVAVPKGTPSFKARVRASDDMGFTSTDYVYGATVTVINNAAPTAPGSITVPAQIVAGRGFTINCGMSTDEDGNLSGYSWERQYDGGTWVEFATGAEPRISTSVPFGTTNVAYRVRAYDTDAAYSDYCTGETRVVINNTAPVISGEDSDLGTFALTPPDAIAYTVTDVDGGVVNCTVTLDGSIVQSGEVVLGEANSYAISTSQWLSMLNGVHVIRITAEDAYGATAERTYTFTKDVAELSVTLAEPWITDGRVARMYILPVWSIPEGATVQVLATNNALDAAPVWQDVTDAVKLGKKFYFANDVKTADQWAVNFKVLADRGTADLVYIKKLTGAFDGIGG